MINSIKRHIYNIKGKSLSQKLLIIESDDWGSIRTSSKVAFNSLISKGYPINLCHYSKNDALESNDDLLYLFEVLDNVKDLYNNPAKITLNNIVANPDFEKIRAHDFQTYFYEPFPKTLERYPEHDQVMNLYKEGIAQGLIQPQFHGREHVHINHWLNDLQNNNPIAHDAFQQKMFTLFSNLEKSSCNYEYLNAMATYTKKDFDVIKESIQEGLALFHQIWGFNSKTLIAPCYNWHNDLDEIFFQNGIVHIQTGRVQYKPTQNVGINSIVRRHMGQLNEWNQRYTTRNVYFEPSIIKEVNPVDRVLKEIETAFFWRKPAIISSHRLNYVGWLNPQNRDNNLLLLKDLLKKIVKVWPEVKFISSDQLIPYYNN